MLDKETKDRIETARDILVGKVPDPKSQVEQITIALIYKFMDDMDKESISLGGEASFFSGKYKKYSWTNIFDPKLGGHDMLALYSEAITNLNLNPNIPQLFRDIFKNAYLPYRDPETLKLFLKTINEFHYDHSEKLGDAFEYLLSVLGSQGDAGQFRTPRHIIDFIVEVLQPKKNETICDPACGTAGFLISSYKHILKENTKKNKGDKLTPDERKMIMQNITGYDISPDMVRLSLANLYLHGFSKPGIHEYDTLTSEDRWNEYYDVILANPPFMSPKGGIKPHKKFSIQANRSEVLFVDYIAEHIHPGTGRAGIIVPEGIIFQSAGAYKQLRKMLVDKNFLYAVVSLPAGIFQPYSGVKTSILLMDKTLAKKTDNILFVKIENDGFDLGAQRRAIDKNDLTGGLELLQGYKKSLQNNSSFDSDNKNMFLVEKEKIAASPDYNLSIDRYRIKDVVQKSNFEMVKLGDISENITKGTTPTTNGFDFLNEGINFIKIECITEDGKFIPNKFAFISEKCHQTFKRSQLKENDILFSIAGALGRIVIVHKDVLPANTNQALAIISLKKDIYPKYIFWILKGGSVLKEIEILKVGVAQLNLSLSQINDFKIPLPPHSIQQQIVTKIESFQKIIDGAKQVVENYKPQIDIDEIWEMVELDSVCTKITDGSHFSPPTKDNGYPYITVRDVVEDEIDFDNCKYIDESNYKNLLKNDCNPQKNDVLFSKDGTVGKVALVDFEKEFVVLSSLAIIRPNTDIINPSFLKRVLQSDYFINTAIENKTGVAIKRIVLKTLKTIPIPLPPKEIQQEIVNRIEQEQQLVNANKELVKLYEQKIKDEINKLWIKTI